MDIGETVYVGSREEWRRWLSDHHRAKKEIWLICYKKGSSVPSVPYHDSVEEAICFGWVDGMTKSIDDRRYGLRFTPRRTKSNWSDSNIARVTKMLGEGKMEEAGLAAVPEEVLKAVRERRPHVSLS